MSSLGILAHFLKCLWTFRDDNQTTDRFCFGGKVQMILVDLTDCKASPFTIKDTFCSFVMFCQTCLLSQRL